MRYYSTQRPITPGTYPPRTAVCNIVNFDRKTWCEEIGREAWGYIDIIGILMDDEIKAWELVPAETHWFAVTVGSKKHGGGIKAVVRPAPVIAKDRPADSQEDTKTMQFKTRYFKGLSEAQRVCDILNSIEITTERVRMSATQGECRVSINGTFIRSFGDKIALLPKGVDAKDYYGPVIGDYQSSEPDSAFVLGVIWHPFDRVYHYGEDVCRKLGISPGEWIE